MKIEKFEDIEGWQLGREAEPIRKPSWRHDCQGFRAGHGGRATGIPRCGMSLRDQRRPARKDGNPLGRSCFENPLCSKRGEIPSGYSTRTCALRRSQNISRRDGNRFSDRLLTRRVYILTSESRFSRDYGLKDQIQRAAGSIMHNVAEGFDGGSNAEFVKFLRYAQRSCTEVQSQLYVALDQKYVSDKDFTALKELAQIARSKIGGFIKYLLAYESKKLRTKNEEPRTKN